MDSAWLVEATVEDLQRRMGEGSLTSEDLALLYMERIGQRDHGAQGYNTVLEVNPDAPQIAAALDRERQLGSVRGPLHGIPVLLKDNIDTGDKMHTSAGSLALQESRAAEDSHVAARLRAAGAVILGKANLTEWANFITDNMPNGFSSRGGQVRNPYGPHDVGGSSSGSAASVAANLTALSVGTETSGSILNPAGQNNVVGIKPTVGLVSRTGIIPISWSQDTAGPFARTVRDAALLLGALTGEDERDAVTVVSRGQVPNDYTAFLDTNALKGARIGVPRSGYAEQLDESRRPVFEQALSILRDAGATLVEPVDLGRVEGYDVLIYEFKPALNAYLSRLDPGLPARSLKDLIDYNLEDPDRRIPHGQVRFLEVEAKTGTLKEPGYAQARRRDLLRSRRDGIDRVLAEHSLDALVFPGAFGSSIAARAGYPSVSVPAGFTEGGQPVGLAFTGLAFSEPKLISLAYAFEQLTQFRRPPV